MSNSHTPIEEAVLKIIGLAKLDWQPTNWNQLPSAEEKAILRCMQAGLIEAKTTQTVSVGPNKQFRYVCRVSGDPLVWGKALQQTAQIAVGLRGWREPTIFISPVTGDLYTHIRLTDEGQIVQADLKRDPIGLLAIICGTKQRQELIAPGRLRIESETDEIVGATPAPADGPTPPKSFCWKGVHTDTVEHIPWALINYMWINRRAKVADVEQAVWGDESETDSRLKSAINKANKSFLQVKCPLQIRKAGDWITLE
jgi:hypothetical protein